MSMVNNALVTGFPAPDGPPYQGQPNAAFGNAAPAAATDSIASGPDYGFWGGQQNGGFGGGLYGGSSSGSTGLGGYGGIMNAFMNLLSGALGSLSSLFGGSTPTPGSGGSTGGTAPNSGWGETYFTSASAHSTGDPHDGFDGTTGAGTTLSDSWNDMNARPNLLRSDSFAGGYDVSTSATAPNSSGVTYNASATVSTNGGRTGVTLDANGSYSVTENGQNVALAQGQAVSLGGNETVTLNADGSLTIADATARGGSIDTTLKSNGPGVDVTASASNVDLGGYLVGRTDSGVDPGVDPLVGAGQNSGIQPFSSSLEPFGTYTAQSNAPFTSLTNVAQLFDQEGV